MSEHQSAGGPPSGQPGGRPPGNPPQGGRPGGGPPQTGGAAPAENVPRQFVNFVFFKVDPAWRRLPTTLFPTRGPAMRTHMRRVPAIRSGRSEPTTP